ncbi:hypothetical protein [Paenibacillus terrae]|uniref:Uncharacterized protein n=1 Tax=Paenibacillus terrae TaxID=159743 RepID=A0A0D7WYX8_9BACL|nr:hypothetical protein [Paenibacillus terrae]KJD42957.1 hypothetical protein QD47_25400 [Paenibacillus terrae]
MILDQIIELYEVEIKYLDEHYSSSSLSSYLSDLQWINEEIIRIKRINSLHTNIQVQTLEALKKSVSKRIKTCHKDQSNNVILDLHHCISELRGLQVQSTEISGSSLPLQII